MRVPRSWLKEYVDLNVSSAELAERLTLAGMEIASIEKVGDWWDPEKIVVGQVVAVRLHPDADRLAVLDIDYGGPKIAQAVTGAPNLFAYKDAPKLPEIKVAYARSGAAILDAHSDKTPRPFKKLKKAEIRGVPSSGMACSERELGLSDEHGGVIFLPADAPVGMPLRDFLGDEILEIELTPDMARTLSMIGVAREVAALTDSQIHLPPDKWFSEGNDRCEDYASVVIENADLCHRYTGTVVRDVEIGPSPQWMQDRLRKAGMRPIDNVVDVTNYVMLEYGQPLHAFDYDFLARRASESGSAKPTIIVRTARNGEEIATLDGVRRKLDESMLLIADTVGPIAIAGVMGGADAQVGPNTRNILLESATFDGINNRRTAQKLKLSSESSYRFTRGVPATLNAIAARRAADLLRAHCRGRIVPEFVDNYPTRQPARVVYTSENQIRRQLGVEVSLEEIASCLQKLDFTVEKAQSVEKGASDGAFGLQIEPGRTLLRCTAPWNRLDVKYPADLTEEVARIWGYDRLPATLMADTLPSQSIEPILETEEKIRDILVGCGLFEVINYALTTEENHEKARVWKKGSAPFVTLANPLSSSRTVMRRSLLVSALEHLAYNFRFSQRHANFEIGRVYLPEQGEGPRPREERRLSVILGGPRRPVGFHPDPGGAEAFDFFDLKGILEELLLSAGLAPEDFEFSLCPDSGTFGSRCAELRIRGKRQGILGELHPEIRRSFELPETRVCLAELELEPLVRPSWSLRTMPSISNYPPVVEDLALVVGEGVTAAQLAQAMRGAGESLLKDIELFDIYRGKPLDAGKKSMAYRLTYQSEEGTLSDQQVSKIRQKILRHASQELGAELRPE